MSGSNNSGQNFPQANTSIVNADGTLTLPGLLFFNTLWTRSGGAKGNSPSLTFNFPITAGLSGQVLTSIGAGNPTEWTTPLTKTSQLANDAGFVTQAQLGSYQTQGTTAAAISAYLLTQYSNTIPLPNTLVGAAGTAARIARADHSHPRETAPSFSGTVTASKLVSGTTSWTSGTGAPNTVQPNGSLYSRTDGTTGARLYVSNGTTWAAVAGV